MAIYVGQIAHPHPEQGQTVAVGVHDNQTRALCLCMGTRRQRRTAAESCDSRRILTLVASPCVDRSSIRERRPLSCPVQTVAGWRLPPSVVDASRPHRDNASNSEEPARTSLRPTRPPSGSTTRPPSGPTTRPPQQQQQHVCRFVGGGAVGHVGLILPHH